MKQLTTVQALNVLFRQDPSERFKVSGAQGRRFFSLGMLQQIMQFGALISDGAESLGDGAMVYKGFIQCAIKQNW